MLSVAILSAVSASYALPDQSETTAAFDPKRLNDTFRRAVDRVKSGIVTISTIGGPRVTPEWAMRDLPPERLAQLKASPAGEMPLSDMPNDSTGSGIVFDERGYIVTCSHVVESAETVFVHLNDGRRVEASKILVDPLTDIAVIQLSEAVNLPVVPMGDSDRLRAGNWVISVGNPYSLGISMSAGIVSATRRHLPDASRARLIQCDAATNPGNSGGALIDLDGMVVGISEGGYGVNEGFQGIGFAIPINDVRRIANQLIENGTIDRAYLGCSTQDVASDVCNYLGPSIKSGLIVTDIVPMTAAQKSGIQVGDVITHVAERPIEGGFRLTDAMETLSPGDELILTVFRGGESSVMKITLGAMKATEEPKPRSTTATSEPSNGYHDVELGMVVDDSPVALREKLRFPSSMSGALVTHVTPRSIASKKGICAGMLVVRVGDKVIQNAADFQREVSSHSLSEGFLILIATPHRKKFVLVQSE